ncbi:MAG: class I SAM-dependent methyltransferase [Planctomycetota bacterium]
MACHLCDSDAFQLVSTRDAKSGKPLDVSICRDCGLVQQTPMPTHEELEQFYSQDYRSEYKGTLTPRPKHVMRAGENAVKRLHFLKQNCSGDLGSLCDIGAGGGEFLFVCRSNGVADAVGYEPNVGYGNHARDVLGVDLRIGQLCDIDQTYDTITMFHVLEHLIHPRQVFGDLWDRMNPGGTLFIEVPWIDSPSISPANTFFKAHTLYFSAETLSSAASAHFERVVVDTSTGNLRMLLERRDRPGPIRLPSATSAAAARQRMANRGWLRYLTTGNGWSKPLRTAAQIFRERSVSGQDAVEVLDNVMRAA